MCILHKHIIASSFRDLYAEDSWFEFKQSFKTIITLKTLKIQMYKYLIDKW
jgi:hypothetical protein